MYWQRLGNLPYKLALQKVCGGNATALDSLIEENVIKLIDGDLCIDFLNEQLSGFENTSKTNSENARNGWLKRRNNAAAMRPHSDPNAIREEKIKEDKKKEDKTNTAADAVTVWPSFDDFWDMYDKKEDRPKCEKKWKNIKQGTREKIMQHLELYVRSTPDKKYRKNPITYLNNQSWDNEIIIPQNGKQSITAQGTLNRLNSYTD